MYRKIYPREITSVICAFALGTLLLPDNVAFAAAGWSPNISEAADKSWCHGRNRHLYRGDFNGDGLTDILCHNSRSGRRRIDFARWDLDGFYGTDFDSSRYSNASQHWCTNSGEEIYVGDFNGDGKDDLLCHVKRGNPNYGRRRIDFANSAGTFFGTDFNSESHAGASQHWCTNAGETIYVGDFNGDGKDDLLCHVSRGNPNYGRRRIDFANSAGTFFGTDFNSQSHANASQHWCTNAGESIYLGDFNGNGKDDLLCHVGRGNTNYGRRRIDFANSAGTFFGTDFNSASYADAAQHWCTNSGESIYVGDFNGDARDDLLCFQAGDGRARIDWANNRGTFFGTNRNHTLNWCNHRGEHLLVADFDGDHRADLLCHEFENGFRKLRYASPGGDFNSICLAGSTLGDGTLLVRDLHFVVLTDPGSPLRSEPDRIPTATSTHTHPLDGGPINQRDDPNNWFRAETELINAVFHDGAGGPVCIGSDCISFRYRGHTLYENIAGSSCEGLRTLADPPSGNWAGNCAAGYCGCSGSPGSIGDCACNPSDYNTPEETRCEPLASDPSKGKCVGYKCPHTSISDTIAVSVDECQDVELRKPGMVNTFIYDDCHAPISAATCADESISRGRKNGNIPYVFIDYVRLLRGDATADRARARGAEQHELGHTLWLGHACYTAPSGSTNAMHHSTICTPARNGDRAAGFFSHVIYGDDDNTASPTGQIRRMVQTARDQLKAWSRCDD